MIHTLANVAGPAFALAEAVRYEIEPGDIAALLQTEFVQVIDRGGVDQIQITHAGRLELRKPRGKPPKQQTSQN